MHETLEKQVADFCHDNHLFGPDERVLVALSGGGDSVALLHILHALRKELSLSLEAAHLNHGLRGVESDGDESFCRDICRKLRIHLTVERCANGEIRVANGSLEEAARIRRLAFLEKTARERRLDRIATGHTRDDQAETVIMRILRGTGPTGLQGILPLRGMYVRPLLDITRLQLRKYLVSVGNEYREDSSNRNVSIYRNRIRLELLPGLERSYGPGVSDGLVRLATLSRIQEDYLDGQVDEAYQNCLIFGDRAKILLEKAAFMAYHDTIRQRVVRMCLRRLEGPGRDTDMTEIHTVLENIVAETGSVSVSTGISCRVEGSLAGFFREMHNTLPVLLTIPGTTYLPDTGGVISAAPDGRDVKPDGIACVNVAMKVIDSFGPLNAGYVREGDVMTMTAGHSPVKVRRIMADRSVPSFLRETVPVIRAGAVPVWIPGIAVSSWCLPRESAMGNMYDGHFVTLTVKNAPLWAQIRGTIGK